jgi:hypothetical protein
MTPTLADLKFKFLAKPDGDLPSNCPPIRKKDGTLLTDSHALANYDVLGIYPVYKWTLWGFRDDKNFDWKASWESQCAVKGGDPAINVPETIKSLDKMQRAELGELSTGATDMLGIIGQKAVRDAKKAIDAGDAAAKNENLEIVARSMDKITDFIDYVNAGDYPGTKLKKDACSGNRKDNCDDSKARGFLALSRITNAAIDSGFTNTMPNRDLVEKKLPPKSVAAASPKMLFRSAARPVPSADPEAVTIDPDTIFKVGADALYQCVITNPDDSLPRDQCLEGIKDMAVVGIANQKDGVVKDALANLGSNYKVKETPEGEKLDDVATWVNSTVWMADGLIDAIQMEGKGLIPRGDKNVDKLIDTIAAQKKETPEEFSTADWITQQVLIHTAKNGITTRHDKIIEKINGDRLLVWNSWISDYLGQKAFERCTEESKDCMSDDASAALKSLSTSIIGGCLRPIVVGEKEGKKSDSEKEKSLAACSGALGKIIEHSGNEDVLHAATDAWFLYGQKDGGVFYNGKIDTDVKEAMKKRFTPSFVGSMRGLPDPSDPKKRQLAESVRTETDAEGWLKEYWLTDMFAGRFSKKDEKTGKPSFKNYTIVTKTRGNEFDIELVRIK